MDIITGIANFLVNEILNKPAIVVGIVVLIGLVALRKSGGEIIGGTLKAILGFIILGVGATAVVNALNPLGTMILAVVGADGVVPTNEAITAIVSQNADVFATVSWVMLLGFVVNLVLARFTPMKYIFLTGHHILFMATMLAVVLYTAGIKDLANIVTGGILLGVIMVVMPTLGQPFMRQVTGGQPVAIGHFGTLGYIAGGYAGKWFGRGSRSTEEMQFSRSWSFLRDAMVATGVAMIVIYAVFAIWYSVGRAEADILALAGVATSEWAPGSLIVFGVIQALTFAGGVAVILLGVRTILGEIVPAFAGIAAKIVPDALPALDCPVTFPFAPNAVLIGFIFSFAGGLIGLAVLGLTDGLALGLALILPGMVPHFFTGGTAGVFGNATGGRIGAALGGLVNGLLITFLPAFLLKVMTGIGLQNTTYGDADFGWFGILVGNVAGLEEPAGILVYAVLAVVAVLLLALAWWVQTRIVGTQHYEEMAGVPEAKAS